MGILEIMALSFWFLILLIWLALVYHGLEWIEKHVDNWLDKFFCMQETNDEADI